MEHDWVPCYSMSLLSLVFPMCGIHDIRLMNLMEEEIGYLSGVPAFHAKYPTPVTRLSSFVSILHFCLLPGTVSDVLGLSALGLFMVMACLTMECLVLPADFAWFSLLGFRNIFCRTSSGFLVFCLFRMHACYGFSAPVLGIVFRYHCYFAAPWHDFALSMPLLASGL